MRLLISEAINLEDVKWRQTSLIETKLMDIQIKAKNITFSVISIKMYYGAIWDVFYW